MFKFLFKQRGGSRKSTRKTTRKSRKTRMTKKHRGGSKCSRSIKRSQRKK